MKSMKNWQAAFYSSEQLIMLQYLLDGLHKIISLIFKESRLYRISLMSYT